MTNSMARISPTDTFYLPASSSLWVSAIVVHRIGRFGGYGYLEICGMAYTDQPVREQDDTCLGKECIRTIAPSDRTRPQPKISSRRLALIPQPVWLSHPARRPSQTNQKET